MEKHRAIPVEHLPTVKQGRMNIRFNDLDFDSRQMACLFLCVTRGTETFFYDIMRAVNPLLILGIEANKPICMVHPDSLDSLNKATSKVTLKFNPQNGKYSV